MKKKNQNPNKLAVWLQPFLNSILVFNSQLLKPSYTHRMWQHTCYSCSLPKAALGELTFKRGTGEGMQCFLLDQRERKNCWKWFKTLTYPKSKWLTSSLLERPDHLIAPQVKRCWSWHTLYRSAGWAKKSKSNLCSITAPYAVELFTGVANGVTLLSMSPYTSH